MFIVHLSTFIIRRFDNKLIPFTFAHMQAEIITIGDEILIGQITDTNSKWIAEQLNIIGVSVYQITSIQDEKEHIIKAIAEAEEMLISLY